MKEKQAKLLADNRLSTLLDLKSVFRCNESPTCVSYEDNFEQVVILLIIVIHVHLKHTSSYITYPQFNSTPYILPAT